MANSIPTDIAERLVAAWPTLDSETQTIFFAVLGTLLPENEPLLEELAEVGDISATPGQPAEDQTARQEPTATNGNLTLRERQIAAYALQSEYTPPPRGAWKRSVGIFADDPLAAEVFEEVQRAREAERPTE